jgi:large subunit ribosomal protein L24
MKRQKKLTGGFHKCHVKKGEQVQIITGDHKGKTGTVISVSTKLINGPKVKVQGVNFIRKKIKDDQSYKYIEAEGYIHASNVRKI